MWANTFNVDLELLVFINLPARMGLTSTNRESEVPCMEVTIKT